MYIGWTLRKYLGKWPWLDEGKYWRRRRSSDPIPSQRIETTEGRKRSIWTRSTIREVSWNSSQMKAMTVSSNYVFPPTKFNFRKVGRVTASILAFLRKIGFEKKSERKFRMFSVKRWRVSVIWSCQSSEKKSWMIILPRKIQRLLKMRQLMNNLWAICMLVFAGVQKILFQITRERLMCTLKTRIYLWPCSAGTWQGARKSSSSTRSMSRRSLRRRMESCSARVESWTGRGSSPRQGLMKTTWAARCSWTWGPLAVEQAEIRRQGRARGGLRPILRWEYCTTGDALCFKVMVVGPKCQAQTRLQFNST